MSFYSAYVLEHRYDLSNETAGGWLVREVKELVVGIVLGAILLTGLYGLLWYGGGLWWLWVWVGWLLLAVVLTQLFPILILPIFYKATAIEDESLVGRLRHLAEGTGLKLSGVYRLALSEETKKPNAMLTGLGPTRRVLLSDTLLDGFEPAEIETVFVHELGHHLRGHIHKGIALSALAASLVIAGIVWRLGPYAGADAGQWPQAVAALPQVILVVLGVGLILRPITNAIMRGFETQCDRDALAVTGPDVYRSAFKKLAAMSMADPEPSKPVELFFYDHPPIGKRLALADAIGAPSADAPQIPEPELSE
jgi:STE24 endopeptidase